MKKNTLPAMTLPKDNLFGYGNSHPVNLIKAYQDLHSSVTQSKGSRIDPDEYALFALCHIYGWGVEANSTTSIKGLLNVTRRLADNGHGLSCFFMGCYLLHKSTNGEKGKNKEYKTAQKYFKTAVKIFEKSNTDPLSALLLAICYEEGHGIPALLQRKKFNDARALYQYSALCHNAFAKYKYGLILQRLDCHDEATIWLRAANQQGWVAANVPLSKYEERSNNIIIATALRQEALIKQDSSAILEHSLTKMSIMTREQLNQEEQLFHDIGLLAKQEFNPLASFHYGCMLQDRNFDKLAVYHYKNAAKHRLMDAEYNLALCYHKGIGTAQNLIEAEKYFKRAANQQHPYSLYALGWYSECDGHLATGPERDRHFHKALERYKTASKHQDILLKNYCYFAIGRIYSTYRNNNKKAIHYFRKAATHRDRDAMRELARCLMHDTKTVNARDFEEAAQWLKKATEHGDRSAYNLFLYNCWPMLPKLIVNFEQTMLYLALFAWQNGINSHIKHIDELNYIQDIVHSAAKPLVNKTLHLESSMPLPRLTKESVLKEIFSIDRLKLKPDYNNPLGSGGFGIVYSGEYENMPVAVKALNVEKIQTSIQQIYFTQEERTRELQSMVENFRREINRMLFLNHRNIIRMYGFVDDLTSYLIVMDKMEGGSLKKQIDDGRHRSPSEKIRIASEISAGLQYLHNQNMLHNDMKAENVLFSRDNTPVICDFGLSSHMRDVVSGGGTLNWNAPECFEGPQKQPRTIQSDIYSLALVIWSLYSNQIPYNGLTISTIENHIVQQRDLPTIPATTPQSLKDVLLACWSYIPSERPLSVNTIIAVLEAEKDSRPNEQYDHHAHSPTIRVSTVAARTNSPVYQTPLDNFDEEQMANEAYQLELSLPKKSGM